MPLIKGAVVVPQGKKKAEAKGKESVTLKL